MKTVSTQNAPAAIGPYSQAQICGNFVFASGQIPIIPETGAIAEGLEAQANQVFKNIAALLKAAESDELELFFNTSSSPCVIRAADAEEEKFTYMILPVRLHA